MTTATLAVSLQIVVGGFCFLLILGLGVSIAAAVHYVAAMGFAPPWFVTTAGWVEIVLWCVDIYLFGLFLLTEIIRSTRTFWSEVTEPDA